MTNSQCIEVAELWGWELQTVDAGFISTKVTIKVWYKNGKRTKWIESNTKDLVNSWQGFGRTVEAMSNRSDPFYRFICDKHIVEFKRVGLDGMPGKDNFHYWDCSSGKSGSIIEATHLAALEALK